jgi:glutaredoxin
LTDDHVPGEVDGAVPSILVLGRDTCEDTIRSRGYLHLQGIPHVYRNVELDPEADEWNRSFNGGERVTPVILVGDPNVPSAVLIEPSDEELAAAIERA